MLVAVADLGAQHFARRRQADGRLLLEQRVDVARQPLGARARAGRRRATAASASATNLRRVALDERLRLQVPRAIRVGGPGRERLRIAQLDDVAVDASGRRPRRSGARQVGAVEPQAEPPHVARLVDALLVIAGTTAAASSRSTCIAARHRHALRACSGVSRTVIRPSGLSSRTTSPVSVIHDVVVQAGEGHARPGTPESAPRRRRSRLRACRRRASPARCAASPDRRSSTGACAPGARPPLASRRARVQHQRRRLGQRRASSVRVPAAAADRRATRRRPSSRPVTRHRAGAGIEREVERPQREASIDARGRLQDRGGRARRAATSAAGRPPAARSRRRSASIWLTVKPIFSPR